MSKNSAIEVRPIHARSARTLRAFSDPAFTSRAIRAVAVLAVFERWLAQQAAPAQGGGR